PRSRGWSRVGSLEHFRRIRVEQVEDVEVHHRLGPAVPQDLAQPKIDRIQAIAVQRTGLDDLQELDDISTAERPPERRLVDDAGNIERKHLSAEALALHRGEFVPGVRQAAERPADQYVDLRHGVRRQPLQIRLPSRLAMAEGLRPLPDSTEERVKERARAAPGTEDVELRVLRDHAALVLDDVAAAGAALDRDVAQTRVHGDV